MERSIDCRASWKMKQTSLGTCLSLNTNQAYISKLLKITRQQQKHASNPKNKRKRSVADVEESLESIFSKLEAIPEANQVKNLNLIIGFNKSDNTFGWSGFNNALHLYYYDRDEEFFFSRNHEMALVPSLNPSLTFTQIGTKLLGAPFTKCNSEKNYIQRTCQIHEYMAKVLDKVRTRNQHSCDFL